MTNSRHEKREDIPYFLHVHVCSCEASRSDLIYIAYLHMPKRGWGVWGVGVCVCVCVKDSFRGSTLGSFGNNTNNTQADDTLVQ